MSFGAEGGNLMTINESMKCGCEGEWNYTTGAGDIDADGCKFPEAIKIIRELILVAGWNGTAVSMKAERFIKKCEGKL